MLCLNSVIHWCARLSMPSKIDYQGRRFGKAVIVAEEGRDNHGAVMWRIQCDCGGTSLVRGSSLKQGSTKSCGCGIAEASSRPRKHGATHTPLYRRWRGMLDRCTRETHCDYHNYGGRGISVCERWKEFKSFAEDMAEGFDPSLEIERENVNGSYSPDNCRWATRVEQQRNRRNNHRVEWRGFNYTVYEWAERLGHKPNTLIYRLRRGWPIERAMTEGAPPNARLELANAPVCDSPPHPAGDHAATADHDLTATERR
ncbi:hypothetical protein BGCPKDLD_3800 [Methylorubrum suomiense]|uniref:AP2 domain-containing protein n=1 Tax=Methylorubrum suomiense TaxID=144191 RepID=A0ABQ4V2R4_9HYPH|nr:hypothetical protein BGCPKDLD_3800 [Methylorubrum suomiense]